MTDLKKDNFYKIYLAAHNNAIKLLAESRLLFEHNHFSRAYALAFTALEEISKSQFAADVFTGLCKEADFNKFYKNHKSKIRRATWAHLDANSYPYCVKWIGPDVNDTERIYPQEPDFQKRQNALYVGIDFQNRKIITPNEQISEKDAEEMIHIVEVAFDRIWEVTEWYGNQIGTKGFLK